MFTMLMTIVLSTHFLVAKNNKIEVSKEQDTRRYIINGIKHYRLSQPDAALKVTHQGGDYGGIIKPMAESSDSQRAKNDAPNVNIASAYWISQHENLSFDVVPRANLASDRGDKSWYNVRSRLVLFNGNTKIINRYRMRTPASNAVYTEKYAWSGNVNVQNAIQNGVWQQYYQLDPRYFAYFVDDQGLDELLQDPSYLSSVLRNESIYGSKCVLIRITKTLSDGTVYANDCWIDLDHSFIVRKTRETFAAPKASPVLYYESSTPELLQVGSSWFPKSFSGRTFLPIKNLSGKSSVTVVQDSAAIEPVPSTYEWIAKPFDIKWPQGTYVEDIIGNKQYIAQNDNTLKLVAK